MRTAEVVENLLAHHGVKGMRWGIRRKATVGPREVIVRDTRKKIKTSGGEGHPAHPQAVRARTIGQVGKKSGLKALSDEELNEYARRLRLEQDVARLQFNEKSRGAKFIDTLLNRQGSRAADAATTAAGKKAVSYVMAKRAAKIAAATA